MLRDGAERSGYPPRAAWRGRASPSARGATSPSSNPVPAPAAPRSARSAARRHRARRIETRAPSSRACSARSPPIRRRASPVITCVALIVPDGVHDERQLARRHHGARERRQADPAFAGDERQLRDAQVEASAGAEYFGALQARAESRHAVAHARASREPRIRRQRIAALRRRARGQRARELGCAGGVERESRQHHERLAEHGAHSRDQLLAPAALIGCDGLRRARPRPDPIAGRSTSAAPDPACTSAATSRRVLARRH